jgi:hypothetical protein
MYTVHTQLFKQGCTCDSHIQGVRFWPMHNMLQMDKTCIQYAPKSWPLCTISTKSSTSVYNLHHKVRPVCTIYTIRFDQCVQSTPQVWAINVYTNILSSDKVHKSSKGLIKSRTSSGACKCVCVFLCVFVCACVFVCVYVCVRVHVWLFVWWSQLNIRAPTVCSTCVFINV